MAAGADGPPTEAEAVAGGRDVEAPRGVEDGGAVTLAEEATPPTNALVDTSLKLSELSTTGTARPAMLKLWRHRYPLLVPISSCFCPQPRRRPQ